MAYDEKIRRWVQAAFERHGLETSREASRRTGVNHVTLSEMRAGKRVSEASIVRFARALGEDVEAALAQCGYEAGVTLPAAPDAPDLAYVVDDQDRQEWLSFYDGLPPELRSGARAILLAWRESLRPYEEGRTFGRHAPGRKASAEKEQS